MVAEQARTPAINTADAAIDAAEAQRRIAEAQLAEGTADPDDGPLREAVTAAETGLATAQTELAALEASAGSESPLGRSCSRPCCRRT